MTKKEELCYWRRMLSECLKRLGYDDIEAKKAGWVVEREDTIAVLRDVCESFGDNDWDNDLSLADVIEKHLSKYLFQGDK